MTDIAIRVDGLGKCYKLGVRSRAGGQARRMSDLFGDIAAYFHSKGTAFWALRNVSFDVMRGDVVGIIGGNGAGKSTLLKILSRVVQPTEGSAEVHGRLGSLLEVGTGFHPELTGRENIFMSGIILGMSRSEVARQFDEIVDFAGVEQFLDTPVKRYSSGMQTRLGFAVAAYLEPDILIVDEVLAVGDAEFQKKCLGKMKEVAGHGRTILFVSHNMNAIQSLCSRAIWLQNGSVRDSSTAVRQLTLDYLSNGSELVRAEWISSARHADDARVVPLAMRLRDFSGAIVAKPLPNDANFSLELEFDVRHIDATLTIGYALYTEDGETIWWSCHNDSDPARWPTLKLGSMRFATTIPSNVLNEGRYRIEFICRINDLAWQVAPGTGPSIMFEIQGGLSNSPLWHSRRTGLCAPILEWRGAA